MIFFSTCLCCCGALWREKESGVELVRSYALATTSINNVSPPIPWETEGLQVFGDLGRSSYRLASQADRIASALLRTWETIASRLAELCSA